MSTAGREENGFDIFDHLEDDCDPTDVSRKVESIKRSVENGSENREI